jgi:hypothetical protein
MENIKNIILPPPTSTVKLTKENTKKIEKQERKRQITTTPIWTFTEPDLIPEKQLIYLYDISKQPFIYQQIRNKLSSYRSQDIEKEIFEKELVMDLSGVLQKMEKAEGKCFYCKNIVYLLYDNVRDPRQWTLERLDNKKGHWFNNVEIACLSCNLKRRTMKYERYIMTKEIQTVLKIG